MSRTPWSSTRHRSPVAAPPRTCRSTSPSGRRRLGKCWRWLLRVAHSSAAPSSTRSRSGRLALGTVRLGRLRGHGCRGSARPHARHHARSGRGVATSGTPQPAGRRPPGARCPARACVRRSALGHRTSGSRRAPSSREVGLASRAVVTAKLTSSTAIAAGHATASRADCATCWRTHPRRTSPFARPRSWCVSLSRSSSASSCSQSTPSSGQPDEVAVRSGEEIDGRPHALLDVGRALSLAVLRTSRSTPAAVKASRASPSRRRRGVTLSSRSPSSAGRST